MSITKPDFSKIWASGAAGGNVIDPDITTPGKYNAGWVAEVPTFEHFNYIQKLLHDRTTYLHQLGGKTIDVSTDILSQDLTGVEAVSSLGYATKGDLGDATWKFTSNNIPANAGTSDLANGLLYDSTGNEFKIYNSIIDVKCFGAFSGVASDQSTIIQNVVNFCGTEKRIVTISPDVDGNQDYQINNSVTLEGSGLTVIFKSDAYLKPNSSSLLQPLIIGGTSQPSRMNIICPRVVRAAYDGGTENIGITFLEMNQSTIYAPESRFSKYNHVWDPTTGGNQQNTYINTQGIGGYCNFWMKERGIASDTGYTNENDFVGGRGFCTANTNTNFKCDGGTSPYGTGHNRIAMSLEGTGVQGIYDNGDSNNWLNCRSEGTWSSGAFHVFGPNCLRPFISSSRLDYTIDESAALDANPQIIGNYRMGSKCSTAINGLTTQTYRNDSASAGSAVDYLNTRDNDDAYAWRSIREIADESGTHDGSSGASVLSDSGASFPTSGTGLVGRIIYNRTDGSKGMITANTATTITATLLGGLENDWDSGDSYEVYILNGSLTTSGRMKLRKSLHIEQSAYSFEPFRIGSNWVFFNGTQLYLKSGTAPSSGTDGNIIPKNETSVAAGLGNIANVINTTNKYAGKMVFDTGLNQPVWATGSTAGSIWVYADGTTAYTPA